MKMDANPGILLTEEETKSQNENHTTSETRTREMLHETKRIQTIVNNMVHMIINDKSLAKTHRKQN